MDKLILEEIQRIKLLSRYDGSKTINEQADDLNTSIAKEIHASVSGPGTDPTKFRNGVAKIKSATQFWQVNKLLLGMYSNLGIMGWINDDMDSGNLYTVEIVSKHLKSIGINNEYKTEDSIDANRKPIKRFKVNSFKILATPKAVEPKVAATSWTDFPCVTGFKGATQQKLKDGSISYIIKGITYYSNGRKMLADKKTMANYTCKDIEFKVAPKTVTIPTPKELKDTNGIKLFQDWLDVNAKGWATGYKDGILNKGQNGKGYGSYGPRTQKAWNTNGRKFLSRDTEEMKPMDAKPITPITNEPPQLA